MSTKEINKTVIKSILNYLNICKMCSDRYRLSNSIGSGNHLKEDYEKYFNIKINTETDLKIKELVEIIQIPETDYVDLIILFTNYDEDYIYLILYHFINLLKSYPTKYFKKMILNLDKLNNKLI